MRNIQNEKRTCFGDPNLIVMTNVYVKERPHYFTTHPSTFAYNTCTEMYSRGILKKIQILNKDAELSLSPSNPHASGNCLSLYSSRVHLYRSKYIGICRSFFF